MLRRLVCLGLILSVMCTSGCYSIRKKFVRKKKHEKDIPVYVDFKDYPASPSKEAYCDYHLFLRGWLGKRIAMRAAALTIVLQFEARMPLRGVRFRYHHPPESLARLSN